MNISFTILNFVNCDQRDNTHFLQIDIMYLGYRYHCHTCKMVDGMGVCTVCAKVCHKDHELSYAKYGSFFCDCGAKEDGSCQVMVKMLLLLLQLSVAATQYLFHFITKSMNFGHSRFLIWCYQLPA